MSAKPVIGVISCNREIEGEAGQTVKNRYLDGVSRYADAIPMIIPTNAEPSDSAAIVARLDGLLLTGSSSNIEPERYGVEQPGRLPSDARRDAMSGALIKAAIAAGKPVFGICRGFQEINVALGGTLVDQRDTDNVAYLHHAPDGLGLEAMFNHFHAVDVLPGTPLQSFTGSTGLTVNSVHFQTIGRLGEGLRINAVGNDGVIESISTTDTPAPVFAVQWHPEWHPDNRPHDLAFWRYLHDAAAAASKNAAAT
jgi:putative glutamine amidotransferase